MQQMQSDLKVAEQQRAQAFVDLEDAKTNHKLELQQINELNAGKLRAKEYEIQTLYEQLEDREAIAGEKISDARLKLNQAEKSISKRVEQEYAAILEKKEQQLKFHDQARQEAQANLLQIESDWKLERRQLITEYEARIIHEREKAAEEI